jgi:hypothetical protein
MTPYMTNWLVKVTNEEGKLVKVTNFFKWSIWGYWNDERFGV